MGRKLWHDSSETRVHTLKAWNTSYATQVAKTQVTKHKSWIQNSQLKLTETLFCITLSATTLRKWQVWNGSFENTFMKQTLWNQRWATMGNGSSETKLWKHVFWDGSYETTIKTKQMVISTQHLCLERTLKIKRLIWCRHITVCCSIYEYDKFI